MRRPALILFLLAAACATRGIQAMQSTVDRAMVQRIRRVVADESALRRRYAAPFSEARFMRLVEYYANEISELDALPYEKLGVQGRADWHALRGRLQHGLDTLELESKRDGAVRVLLPWIAELVDLLEKRENVEPVDAQKAAARIARFADRVREKLDLSSAKAIVRQRAVRRVQSMDRAIGAWFDFRAGYDPMFSWWTKKPVERARAALRDVARALERSLEGDSSLIGDPIGDAALTAALRHAWIPYTAQELIAIAEDEFRWVQKQRARAAKVLGCKDWREAQEKVKDSYVKPGEQPALIRKLANEAIEWVESRQLVTIPALAKETWRMSMMSPRRQLVSPYFLGGEVIQVSYPTDTMEHAHKLMSMRGNNPAYSRATVQHELIPGHHLQQFMNARFKRYRSAFRTPFWIEGWCLWWEMHLWDLDFPQTAEQKIGMLFWRAHRCARIVFSLKFQLGEWNAQQCIDYLVREVGHERRNATAEVRRSIGGAYGPLYQAAYLLGGMQFRTMYRELVSNPPEGRKMWSERQFHDRILRENMLPLELLRAVLRGDKLPKDAKPTWRFAGR